MKACKYISKGHFELTETDRPVLVGPKDAVVRVTVNVETLETKTCDRMREISHSRQEEWTDVIVRRYCP